MLDRRLLIGGVAAVGALAGLRWLHGGGVEAAGSFEVQKTDSEWRSALTRPQYDVLRLHRTEIPGLEPARSRSARGHLRLCRLRFAVVLVGNEIRQQDRVAELLPAAARCRRYRDRPCSAAAAYRSPLPAMRWSFGPRLRRWPAAYRIALLHQRRGIDILARRTGLMQ